MSSLNDTEQQSSPAAAAVKLQKLGPKHREVLSLVAQGLSRVEIAEIVGFEPEYISWLVRQDVCKQYLQEMIAVVDFRLQTMTVESVDVIADIMKCGTSDEKLKAAKLQLEAVGRVGAGKGSGLQPLAQPDHLQQLADRLVGLLKSSQGGSVYENEVKDETVVFPV